MSVSANYLSDEEHLPCHIGGAIRVARDDVFSH